MLADCLTTTNSDETVLTRVLEEGPYVLIEKDHMLEKVSDGRKKRKLMKIETLSMTTVFAK